MVSVPKVSIIVPLFNHLRETQVMFASLLATLGGRTDVEVILIDDGSSDGTREWLDTLAHPRVRTLKNASNMGYAGVNNVAVRQSRGELLVFANNDLVFQQGWLEPMLDILGRPELKAGLVGNVQRAVSTGLIDHAGVEIDQRGHVKHLRSIDDDEAGKPFVERFAVTAACCAIRRSVFDDVGGFDEEFVNGFEDIDLNFKVAARGYVNYVALQSTVLHHVSLSRGQVSPREDRNFQLLLTRWRTLLESSLAALWADRLASRGLFAPSGSGGTQVALSGQRLLDAADLIAKCVLRRDEVHRAARIAGTPLPKLVGSLTVTGHFTPSDTPSHVHLEGEMRVDLADGAGLDGVVVSGYFHPGGPPDGRVALWAVLQIGELQRVDQKLKGGYFRLGVPRPLLATKTSARFWLESRNRADGSVSPPSRELQRAVHLKELAVDGRLTIQLSSV